jgi:hypothetical protein
MDKKSEMPFNPYIGAQKLLIAQHCNKIPYPKPQNLKENSRQYIYF